MLLVVVQSTCHIDYVWGKYLKESSVRYRRFHVVERKTRWLVIDKREEKRAGADLGDFRTMWITPVSEAFALSALILDLLVVQFSEVLQFFERCISISMYIRVQ